METTENPPLVAPPSAPSEPSPRQSILVLWICSQGRLPDQDQCDHWTRSARDSGQEMTQRALMGTPEAKFGALVAKSSPNAGAISTLPGATGCPVIETDHWGQTLKDLADDRPWKSVIFLSSWLQPEAISQEVFEGLANPELDGVTFYRQGAKPPFPIWLGRLLLIRPVCFLLEIPWNGEPDWLGWGNWFWEKSGAWFFGVKNRDPLFPCRAFSGRLFQQTALQSRSAWVWMEMLAKLHFLGARLSERRLVREGEGLIAAGDSIEWKDMSLVWRSPQFRALPEA